MKCQKLILIFLLFSLSLFGCQNQPEANETQEESEVPITGDLESSQEADFSGIYTQGDNYREFKACDSWEIYTLANGNTLSKKYDSLQLQPGEPMFVRLNARTDTSSQQGDQAVLQVAGVVSAEAYQGQNDCPSFSDRTFVFRGNEPFWSLTMDGDSVIFNHFERDSVVFAYSEPSWQDSVWVLNADNQEHRLSAYISEKECRGSMSGIRYDMSILVETAGETYQGCGGWDARENKPGP